MDPLTLSIIGLLAGATTGWFSHLFSSYTDSQKVQREQQTLTDAENDALKSLDTQFEAAKNTANKNADKADRANDLQEGILSSDFNAQLDAIEEQQKGQTLQYNVTAMNNGQTTGNSLSSMAASGTRNSSMADAVDMEASVNSQLLQQQEDQDRASNKYSLANLFGGLTSGVANIQEGRTDAVDLRNSYLEGGDQYNIYSVNRQNTQNNYARQRQALTDSYNDYYSGWNGFLNGLKSTLSGGSTGWNLGTNIGNYLENNSTPTYDTEGNVSNWWNKLATKRSESQYFYNGWTDFSMKKYNQKTYKTSTFGSL